MPKKKTAKKTARERKIKDRFDLAIDADLVKKLSKIVEAGNFRYVAIRKGKKELRDFESGRRDWVSTRAILVEELEKAEGKCHARILQDIVSSDNLNAKMWFLERRYNKMYTKNPNAKIDDESGETIKIDAASLLAEKLSQLMGEE